MFFYVFHHFSSKTGKPAHYLATDPVDRGFQVFLGGLQHIPDGNILGAMLLTFSAANAVGSGSGIFPQSGTHPVLPEAAEPALGMVTVPGSKGAGDIHGPGAGHTVAAAGAAHLHSGIDGRHHRFQHCFFPLSQFAHPGFRGGLYILGARPAMGKSTYAINLADNIKGNCLYVSLEMTPEQIVSKRISRLTDLSAAKLLSGRVTEDDWTKIALAFTALSEQGVYINDRYDLTVQKIQLLAQSVPDLRAVIVDYLGLIQPATRSTSSYENITQISRELKRMAISLNVPVICLCQLSRTVESREDKRPRLSDLRDSGAIEQDADAVMFLYRPDYYTGGKTDGQPSLTHLEVAKNRHGRTGQTDFNFWMPSSTFLEIP